MAAGLRAASLPPVPATTWRTAGVAHLICAWHLSVNGAPARLIISRWDKTPCWPRRVSHLCFLIFARAAVMAHIALSESLADRHRGRSLAPPYQRRWSLAIVRSCLRASTFYCKLRVLNSYNLLHLRNARVYRRHICYGFGFNTIS